MRKVADIETLQQRDIFGISATPLPDRLCLMSHLPHGRDFSRVEPAPSLNPKPTDIADTYRERAAVERGK